MSLALPIGSVCTGIGGFDLAFEQAGFGPVRWQVENDPYRRLVLERHWPDARQYRDLSTLDPHALEPVSILLGGTPCQDLSLAGKGAGLQGSRSSLWFRMRDIVHVLRPVFVVWENVPGSVRRGLERVVADLCHLGYHVVGTKIAAADVGAPHLRERVFLVAVAPDALRELIRHQRGEAPGRAGWDQAGEGPSLPPDDGEARPLADGEGQLLSTAARVEGGDGPAHGGHASHGSNRRFLWPPEPGVGRVADGVPYGPHRLAALGDAIVPGCARVAADLILDFLHERIPFP